jgi:hypothetical protein
MPAGLVVPISGPYVGLWDALPLGTQNDDGFELQATIQGQEVAESDAWGMTLVEAIYRGQNWRVRFRGLEWDRTGLLSILQMFGKAGGARSLTPILNNIGHRWTFFSKTLLLTSILADPPAFPQTLTALNGAFAPNTVSSFLFTSKMREFPLEMVLIPYTSTAYVSATYNVPFTTT